MCGDCGKHLVGESGTSRTGKKYYYYKCSTAKKKGDCHRKPLKKDVVEDIVISQTMRSVFQSHSLDAIVDHVMMWQQKENTTLPLLQRELADVENSLANVMNAIEQGIITSTTKNRMKELEDLKTDIEVKIAREEIQAQVLTKEQATFWLQRMADFDLANHDNKQLHQTLNGAAAFFDI